MKKILDGAGGFFRSRVLWALVGFGLVIYVSELLFYFDSNIITMYVDGLTALWMAVVGWFVLFLAGAEKDFVRGIRLVIFRPGSVSMIELRRASKAVESAGKILVVEGIVAVATALVDVLYSFNPDFPYYLPIALAVISVTVLYTALFYLLLLPVRIRLQRMILSYMEEPEEEPQEEEGQRAYFCLRGMGLTDREKEDVDAYIEKLEAEVARLVHLGLSNREVGQKLYITTATVKKHMTHILEKTGCGDREALARKLHNL